MLPSGRGATILRCSQPIFLRIPAVSAQRHPLCRHELAFSESMAFDAVHPQQRSHSRLAALSCGTKICQSQQYRFKPTIKPFPIDGHSNTKTTGKSISTRFLSDCASFQNDPEDVQNSENEEMESHNDYSVTITKDGQAICISSFCRNLCGDGRESSEDSWEFASSLLWVNDPQYIHTSSGQRLRTLGQYSRGFEIVRARLLFVDTDDSFVDGADCADSSTSLHPAPPRGSMHSRGGLYDIASDCLEKTKDKGRTLVQLEWNYGEESIFDLVWLIDHARNNCLGQDISSKSKSAIKTIQVRSESRKRPCERFSLSTAVSKEIAIGAMDNPRSTPVSSFDYKEILENDEVLFEGMQDVFEAGVILIRNAPDLVKTKNERRTGYSSLDEVESSRMSESIVGNLGRRFSGGTLSHGSLYGDIFHVQSKHDPENIAYTNVALPPHQDLTYYESKPFLQLLHCATNSRDDSNYIVGGESILIDGLAAAEELRRICPEIFDVLLKTEATFVKERHDADMVSPKPHVVVDPTYGQVVEVNWSPPFEGPLQMNPRVAVEDYILAYQAFERIVDDNHDGTNSHSSLLSQPLERVLGDYAKEYTWEYAMREGEILVFNNQRMLHGRRSFRSVGTVQRHLIGCYTDALETSSRYRQLLRDRERKNGGGYGRRNTGSGCRWM